MNELKLLLSKELFADGFISCSLSSPFTKTSETKNITIRPLKANKKQLKVEFKYLKHNDIKTMNFDDLFKSVSREEKLLYKQIHIKSTNGEIQILSNKKGKHKILKNTNSTVQNTLPKNRTKSYIIPDGTPCDFLIEIGVMAASGKVKSQHYKKFKQINRFLEIVDDMFKDKLIQNLHLVDFGCGKSYLTFALYYYFKNYKSLDIHITGVDLKQEVIDHCNEIAVKLNYSTLEFVHGFIHNFTINKPIDFVVTLHACDTATDEAILFSLKHNVEQMMFVPCCQHELNKQIQNSNNTQLLKFGILRDRLTALITDSMRSQVLELAGYKVQCMEFIELEHTAKNILLRCSKVQRPEAEKEKIREKYTNFKENWSIEPYLEKQAIKDNFISTR